jgi:hypothetical protein
MQSEAQKAQVQLTSLELGWAMCGRGVHHALLQGVGATQVETITSGTEILTSYGGGYDFSSSGTTSVCPPLISYLQRCPDFRSGGGMGLINAVYESEKQGEKTSRSKKPCKGSKKPSRILHGMDMMSRVDERLVIPVSHMDQDVSAKDAQSGREVLESMLEHTGVKVIDDTITVYVPLRFKDKYDPPILDPIKPDTQLMQERMWEDYVEAPGIGRLAHGTIRIDDQNLEDLLAWFKAGKSGIRRNNPQKNKIMAWFPKVTFGDPNVTGTLNQFNAFALGKTKWQDKVMLRGYHNQKPNYFRLTHFLTAASYPEAPRGHFRMVDGQFVRATKGNFKGVPSPWIHWIDGGASAPVGSREDRFLMAIDEQSIVEQHLRNIDPLHVTGPIGPVGQLVIRGGFNTADRLVAKAEHAVRILYEHAKHGDLDIEYSDVRQAIAWYTPDLLLQACARPRLGWWLRMVSDFLRAVWEPTVASQLPIPPDEKKSPKEHAEQATHNLAALWALEHRCAVQINPDEVPGWQSTDLYLLATINALNRMMLEVLDSSLPMSPLARHGSTTTHKCPDPKGFGLYATRDLPLSVPSNGFIKKIQKSALDYGQYAPQRAMQELIGTSRRRLQRENMVVIEKVERSSTAQQLLTSNQADAGADDMAVVTLVMQEVGALFEHRAHPQKRRRHTNDYTGLLRNVRRAMGFLALDHPLRTTLNDMIRTLRFCSSLQLLVERSIQRRKYQGCFAVAYVTHEKNVVLPMGFMRGIIMGKTAPTGGREPQQHLNRLAVKQTLAALEAGFSYDFPFAYIDQYGQDVGNESYRLACTFEFTAPMTETSTELIFQEQLLRWAVIADRVAYPLSTPEQDWVLQYQALVSSRDTTAQAVWQFGGYLHHHGDPRDEIKQPSLRTTLGLQALQAVQRHPDSTGGKSEIAKLDTISQFEPASFMQMVENKMQDQLMQQEEVNRLMQDM